MNDMTLAWDLRRLLQLRERLSLPAVPARRAAEILGVDRRSVYRYLESGRLELVPKRGGKAWVSIRSLAEFLKAGYARTDKFDALAREPLMCETGETATLAAMPHYKDDQRRWQSPRRPVRNRRA